MRALTREWTFFLVALLAVMAAGYWIYRRLKSDVSAALPSAEKLATAVSDIRAGLPGAIKSLVKGESAKGYVSPEEYAAQKQLIDAALERKRRMGK